MFDRCHQITVDTHRDDVLNNTSYYKNNIRTQVTTVIFKYAIVLKMVLQTTGVISFTQIQTEFGGTNPISLSEYYTNAVGGYTTGVTGLPATGAVVNTSTFRGKAKPAAVANGLYNFSAFTFTNAGATGRNGPTLSQARSAYSAASWAQDTTNNYLNMTTEGIQLWKVPATGSYTITCAGAGGNVGTGTGGRGYVLTTNQTLTQGQVLKILVGQVGTNAYGKGGGGGSFVATSSNTPLIVAGGGGGTNYATNQAGQDATGVGGSDVAGADGDGRATGGCGMNGAGGASFTYNSAYATSFINGGTGGSMPAGGCVDVSYGGFGGGGGGGNGGGAGGGYTGGKGGNNSGSYPGGAGGGSYCSTSVTSTSYNSQNTEGYVTITPNFTITTGSLQGGVTDLSLSSLPSGWANIRLPSAATFGAYMQLAGDASSTGVQNLTTFTVSTELIVSWYGNTTDNCPDVGISITATNTNSTWVWGSDANNIRFQNNCTTPNIYATQATFSGTVQNWTQGQWYTSRCSYNPQNGFCRHRIYTGYNNYISNLLVDFNGTSSTFWSSYWWAINADNDSGTTYFDKLTIRSWDGTS